ncbi:MAG: DUF2628 domain-containing protein [Alphaproteobacteria bacterium]|nr:DUF2628 domain-containing protein [Alphaproteobacteria bacterium]
MATYSIFCREGGSPDSVVFVKEGFSVPAMVFTVLWALWHKMWIAAAVMLVVMALVAGLFSILAPDDQMIAVVNLAAGLVLGFEAHRLRCWSLTLSGYRQADLIQAQNIDEAEWKYFLHIARQRALVVHTSRKLPATDDLEALGLFGMV